MKTTPPQPRTSFWIHIHDHLPDDATTVLVQDKHDEIYLAYHDSETGDWLDASTDHPHSHITHWMDLPEPATDSNSKQLELTTCLN